VQGEVTEIRSAELRFTIEEAAALLKDRMGLDLSPADVEWAACLCSIGCSVRPGRWAAGAMRSATWPNGGLPAGRPDLSLFTYHPVDFRAGLGYPTVAKLGWRPS
jgi:hypothetical protein